MTDYQNWGALLVSNGQTLLEFFNAFMGFEDNANDAAANRSLDIAGSAVELYLDRTVAKREVVEDFPHHFGVVILHDPQVDVSTPPVVTLNGEGQTNYDVYLARDKLAHLTRLNMRQDVPMDWRAYDQVSVTYTAGYDPLPLVLAQALSYVAAGLFQADGTGSEPGGASGDIKSMSIYDVGSMSFDVGSSNSGSSLVSGYGVITETSAQLLQAYKRPSA